MEVPKFFQGSNYCSQFPSEKPTPGDHFIVEDLLDFSNDEVAIAVKAYAVLDSVAGHSTDSSTITIVDSCNSSFFSGSKSNFGTDVTCRNIPDSHFSDDLHVPCDDLAELEWLSNFVEESFSSEYLQKLQLIGKEEEYWVKVRFGSL